MERPATYMKSYFYQLGLVNSVLLLIIPSSVSKVQNLFSQLFHIQPCNSMEKQSPEFSRKRSSRKDGKEEVNISRKDAEIVMEDLGIFCSSEGNELQDMLGSSEISGLFEERIPSQDEIKEAFDVFDDNGDGFIDAREVQRILCILGFREGSKLVECDEMISRFDRNRDGKVDFEEFVKLMEQGF